MAGRARRELGRAADACGEAIVRVVAAGLTKSFGSSMALRGVDATFEAGGLTLLEGANGSGKSTLLAIIGTVMRATSGTVIYEPIAAHDVRELSVAEMARVRGEVGWVSHETLAYPDLTGRQNVELAARFQGLDRASAWAEARERFELGSFAERPLRTCSRGQRQRVALARALVHRPSLVLLDEPTAGLDKVGVGRLREVVRGEVERGAVVVVVSHEPEVFLGVGGAVGRLRLERGRVVDGQVGS
jgi:heme exporter protein A